MNAYKNWWILACVYKSVRGWMREREKVAHLIIEYRKQLSDNSSIYHFLKALQIRNIEGPLGWFTRHSREKKRPTKI